MATVADAGPSLAAAVADGTSDDSSSAKRGETSAGAATVTPPTELTNSAGEFQSDVKGGSVGGSGGGDASGGEAMSSSTRQKRYVLGLITLLCVVVLWVASSSMIQSIFLSQNFNKPFFLTYFSTSLFTVYLAIYAIGEHYKKKTAAALRAAGTDSATRSSPRSGAAPSTLLSAADVRSDDSSALTAASASSSSSSVVSTAPATITTQVTVAPVDVSTSAATAVSADGTPHSVTVGASAGAGAAGATTRTQRADSKSNTEERQMLLSADGAAQSTPQQAQWGLKETARLAAVLCPLWFLMNYLFNLSLTLTSIASTTILSSTSGLFVVMIGFFFLGEKLAAANLVGVCCTIGGAVLVSVRDYWEASPTHASGETETLHGDIICCVSAMFYASYTVYLNYKVPDDRVMNIQLLFGLIGLINMIAGWPFFIIFQYTGLETYEFPSATVILFLLLNGFFGTVISDMLWAKSVLLTSPLIATIGLSLTIPLAMLADFILHARSFTILYWMGSLLVLSGFVLVNWKFAAAIDPNASNANGVNTGAASATANNNSNAAPANGAARSRSGTPRNGTSRAATATIARGSDGIALATSASTASLTDGIAELNADENDSLRDDNGR